MYYEILHILNSVSYYYHSKQIKTYSTMVKRLAPEREFMSSSPTGAVYFFQMWELLMRAIYYKRLCSMS